MPALSQGLVHAALQGSCQVRALPGPADGIVDAVVQVPGPVGPSAGLPDPPDHELVQLGPDPVHRQPLVPDDRVRRQVAELPPQAPQLVLPQGQGPFHGVVESPAQGIHILKIEPEIKDRQFRGRGRRRGPQVGDKVRDHGVGLVSDRRDDGSPALEDRLGDALLIEGPEVLQGPSAAADDDHVHPLLVEGPDPAHDAVGGRVSLHDGRVEDDLQKGIPPLRDLDDVPDGGACGGCHDSQRPDILRKGLLVAGIEHALLLQLLFEQLESLGELPDPVPDDPVRIELVDTRPLIDLHRAGRDHLVPVLHGKRKPPSTACEHDAGQRPGGILECEINMTGGMVFAVADFSADLHAPQQIIFRKHPPDIGVDPGDRKYIFHIRTARKQRRRARR